MHRTGEHVDTRGGRLHGPYTPDAARHLTDEPSLADRLGGEPYPSHRTQWYEWLAAAVHVALLAAGVALLLFA